MLCHGVQSHHHQPQVRGDVCVTGAVAVVRRASPRLCVRSIHGNSIGDCGCIKCGEINRGELLGWLVSSTTTLCTLDIGGASCCAGAVSTVAHGTCHAYGTGNDLERGTRIHLARCLLANPSLQLRSLIGIDLRDCVVPLHLSREMKEWKQFRLLTWFREHPNRDAMVRVLL